MPAFRAIAQSAKRQLEPGWRVRDDAGKLSVRLKQRKENLPVSRVFAELFRQM